MTSTGAERVRYKLEVGEGCPFCPRVYQHIGTLINHVRSKHEEGSGWIAAITDELSKFSKP